MVKLGWDGNFGARTVDGQERDGICTGGAHFPNRKRSRNIRWDTLFRRECLWMGVKPQPLTQDEMGPGQGRSGKVKHTASQGYRRWGAGGNRGHLHTKSVIKQLRK